MAPVTTSSLPSRWISLASKADQPPDNHIHKGHAGERAGVHCDPFSPFPVAKKACLCGPKVPERMEMRCLIQNGTRKVVGIRHQYGVSRSSSLWCQVASSREGGTILVLPWPYLCVTLQGMSRLASHNSSSSSRSSL